MILYVEFNSKYWSVAGRPYRTTSDDDKEWVTINDEIWQSIASPEKFLWAVKEAQYFVEYDLFEIEDCTI